MSKELKHSEVRSFEKNGIWVHVHIDYDNRTISLVEREKNVLPIRYGAKQWVFAKRSMEYMKSWKNIFDAMEYATDQAAKALKAHITEQEKEIDEKTIGAVMAVIHREPKARKFLR